MEKENSGVEIKVSRVDDPFERDIAEHKMASIRFDCLVKIYDCGVIQPKSNLPFLSLKPLPPQWFKSEIKFTLEYLRYEDPYTIGLAIKEALSRMDAVITEYEKNKR